MLRRTIIYLTILACLPIPAASAENACQAAKSKALEMVRQSKADALRGTPQDSSEFMQKFYPHLAVLQENHCTAEIVEFMRFIKEEQKAYPAPPGAQIHIPGE